MARARSNKQQDNVPTMGSILGGWVRQTRIRQGLSQRELADASGLSRSYVCDIERGRGAEPSLATLDKLATALGTSRSELMQASGLIDKALVPRESDEERRMMAVFRDLTEAGKRQVLSHARWVHQEEHAWKQSSFVSDEPDAAPVPEPVDPRRLTLFELDPAD